MGTRARTVPQNCWVSVPWAAARCLAPRAPCVTILMQIGNHLIVQATPQQDDCLCRIVWRNRVSFSVPAARQVFGQHVAHFEIGHDEHRRVVATNSWMPAPPAVAANGAVAQCRDPVPGDGRLR